MVIRDHVSEVIAVLRKARSVAVILIMVATLAACAPAATAPPAARPAQTGAEGAAPSDWDRIVAEARKEGEVIVWVGPGTDARKHNKDRFEADYPGIKVTLVQLSTNERDARLLREMEAGVAKLDVITTGGANANLTLRPAGALRDLRPFLVLPEVTAVSNWRDGKLLWVDPDEKFVLQSEIRVTPSLALHESVDDTEVQNWEDLLNPKWRGKIVMGDPRRGGGGFAAGLLMYYHSDLGPEFTRRFYSETGVTFNDDERQNVEWVVSGRMLINLRPDNRQVRDVTAVGAKVKVVPSLSAKGKPAESFGGSAGQLFVPNLDPLPHPNAAIVYINWFFSKAGQQAMVDELERASRRLDVDHTKMPDYTVPKPGVSYLDLNRYTGQEATQKMRDDLNTWYASR